MRFLKSIKREASSHWSKVRKHPSEWLTWRLIRFFRGETSFEEVLHRRYMAVVGPLPIFDNAKAPDELLSIAKGLLEESDKRRASVIDKCKTLLTLSALLLPLLLAVTTQVRLPALLLVPAAFFISAAYLILNVLDVGPVWQVSIDQGETTLAKDDLQRRFIRSYLLAAQHNDDRTDYLVDVMRAARWSLMLGLVTLVLCSLFVLTFFKKPDQERGQRANSAPVGSMPASVHGTVVPKAVALCSICYDHESSFQPCSTFSGSQ